MFLIKTLVHIWCTGQVISQSVMSAVLRKMAQDHWAILVNGPPFGGGPSPPKAPPSVAFGGGKKENVLCVLMGGKSPPTQHSLILEAIHYFHFPLKSFEGTVHLLLITPLHNKQGRRSKLQRYLQIIVFQENTFSYLCHGNFQSIFFFLSHSLPSVESGFL